jgi:hypothetical protein
VQWIVDAMISSDSLISEDNLMQFLYAFVNDASSTNTQGYPMDVVRHISTFFLSYLSILIESSTYNADQYLISLRKGTNTLTHSSIPMQELE